MHSPMMQVMLTIFRMQTILIPKIIMQSIIVIHSHLGKNFEKQVSQKKKMREISKELRNLNKVWKMKSITSGPPG